MVPFAIGGMAAWGVAGIILLLSRDWLIEHDRLDWLWICLAGFLLGIPGLAVMIGHDIRRRRHRALPSGQHRAAPSEVRVGHPPAD